MLSEFVTMSDGCRLCVHRLGQGPPVLFFHAAAAESQENWQATGIAPAVVAAGYSAWLVDLRGHGQSDKPHDAGSYHPSRMRADVLELLDLLREPVRLVGYSMGGLVAMLAATDERVERTVVGGVFEYILEPDIPERRDVIAALRGAGDPAELPPHAVAFRDHVIGKGCDPLAIAALAESQQAGWQLELERVANPVLVINGIDDLDPTGIVERLASGSSVRVPGDHLTAPASEEFCDAVVDALGPAERR